MPPAAAAALWTTFLLVVLLFPGDKIPKEVPSDGLDKGVHAMLFYLESFFLRRWLHQPGKGRRDLLIAVFLASSLAFATEAAQLLLPERKGSVGDLLADHLGIVLYTAWTVLVRRDPR